MNPAVALCAERLRSGDADRFAAVMAAPADLRPGLFVLYATNLEIARAPWASVEPMVAEMRLQWWIDALEALAQAGKPVPHEFGAALGGLPKGAIAGLIEAAQARRADCWADPFEDDAALRAYLEATSGALFQAAGHVAGADCAALRHYGAAVGLANWFVAWPELSARGRLGLAGADAKRLGALAREGLLRLEACAPQLRRAGRPVRVAALAGFRAQALLKAAATDPARIAAGTLGGSEFARRLALLRASLTL